MRLMMLSMAGKKSRLLTEQELLIIKIFDEKSTNTAFTLNITTPQPATLHDFHRNRCFRACSNAMTCAITIFDAQDRIPAAPKLLGPLDRTSDVADLIRRVTTGKYH